MTSSSHSLPITSDPFVFSKANEKIMAAIIQKYPEGRQASAVLPLLDLAQRQCGGWLPGVAIEAVAQRLDMPVVRVWEVASFYSMFNLTPCGKHLVQVCRTTPCWLRGAEALTDHCKKKWGVQENQTSDDGLFTLKTVECLGACINAPVVQINDDYYENLTPESLDALLDQMAQGSDKESS